ANFMKMAYVQWNKDSVADETILADLVALSKGELKVDETINLNKVEYRPQTHTQNNNNNRGGRTSNQNNRGGSGGGGGRTNNNPRNNNNQNNRNRNSGGGSKKY
ncbi:DUF4290 domain-containing protein, partial [Mucilaginibacter sp.]|uniref:DUF4290 domain-containing protein n=1 Tax=Mucilaginibacter sp. TaxID=1882438 RepID=UPI00261E7FF8